MPNFPFGVWWDDEAVRASSVLPLSSQFDRLRKLHLQPYHFHLLPASQLSLFVMAVPQNNLENRGANACVMSTY